MNRTILWGLGGLFTLAAVVGVGYHLLHPAVVSSPSDTAVAATTPTAPHSARPAPLAAPTSAEPQAPAFQVASLNAGTIHVPTTRPTVVYFMSAGCGSCISGEQQLAHLATKTPASVQWLSLDVDPGYDTPQAVLSMAHFTGARWPQAFATNAMIQAYHVTQLDMVAVIAKNGTLLYDGALPSSTRLTTLIHQAGA